MFVFPPQATPAAGRDGLLLSCIYAGNSPQPAGTSREEVEKSPFVESLVEKGYEVRNIGFNNVNKTLANEC